MEVHLVPLFKRFIIKNHYSTSFMVATVLSLALQGTIAFLSRPTELVHYGKCKCYTM